MPFGRSGKVVLALGAGPTCTAEQGTSVLVFGLTSPCTSNLPPSFPRTRAAQIECAWAFLEDEVKVDAITLTVDGGPALDLRRRKFEACSPQRHVLLAPGHGVAPEPATFTACGWIAWMADLPVGQHELRSVATNSTGQEIHTWEPTIVVRPRGH